jgi:hypothetical protein
MAVEDCMRIDLDDKIAGTGIAFVLIGIYLWLGLAATFILLGLVLIYVAARIDPVALLRRKPNEPDQATDTQSS